MLQLCDVHIPLRTLSYWSLFRVELLVGFVVAIGGQQPGRGLFQKMFVIHNWLSHLCSPDAIIYVSFFTIYNLPLSFSKYCKLNPVSATRSHHLSLIPPISTINSRRYSFLFIRHLYGTSYSTLSPLTSFNRTIFHPFSTHYYFTFVI